MRVRERPSLRQTIEVVDPEGRRSYWTEDAPDSADAFQDLSYSSAAPGGFATLDCKLTRKIAVAYGDMAPYATCRVRNASGGIDWEGRLERAARTSGREVSANPSAVGFQAALEDDKSVRALYVDSDLTHWVGPDTARQQALITAGFQANGPTLVSGDDPTLSLTATGTWSANGRGRAEAWYSAAGLAIQAVHATFSVSNPVSLADSNWDDVIGGAVTQGGTWSTVQLDTAQRYYFNPTDPASVLAVLSHSYSIAGGDEGRDYVAYFADVFVYGYPAAGMPGHEAAPGIWGFYASDIIDYLIRDHFPTWLRRVTPTSYVITQAAYLEPTTCAEIVKDVNRFHVYDWFVWEGPLFEYRPRAQPGRRWRSQVGPAQLEETGPAADKMWRSVVVSYKDPDGTTKTVGPPGSGAQTTDSSLTNGELDIPADRVFYLSLDTASPGAAIQVGQRRLYEANQVDRSGKAIQVAYVEDADTGILEPASHMRGGDVIMYGDASDTSFRRISNVQWDRPSRTASLDLDSPAESLEAVVARLNADVAGLTI